MKYDLDFSIKKNGFLFNSNIILSGYNVSEINNDNQDAEHEQLTKCPTDCLFIHVFIFLLQIYNAH